LRLPSPLDELADDRLTAAGLRLYLKRDDLINPEIPGNKWRKLKYNIDDARAQGHDLLLTFGGAYSNHIRATAAVGYYFGFATVGIIRGEERLPLNPSLAYAADRGMTLEYLDRSAYRRKMSPEVISALRRRFGEFYLVPEGGTNANGARGCAEIPAEISQPFDVICCPCGTGGTIAGVIGGLKGGQRALGFPVLKGGRFLAAEVEKLHAQAFGVASEDWALEYDYHFGGFAKRQPELDAFIADFRDRHGLELNWVYTAKMMYGIYALAGKAAFSSGTSLVAVVTGGPEPQAQ
jgi:1-aminocyclopropane-1-carboxylate deaminase